MKFRRYYGSLSSVYGFGFIMLGTGLLAGMEGIFPNWIWSIFILGGLLIMIFNFIFDKGERK